MWKTVKWKCKLCKIKRISVKLIEGMHPMVGGKTECSEGKTKMEDFNIPNSSTRDEEGNNYSKR